MKHIKHVDHGAFEQNVFAYAHKTSHVLVQNILPNTGNESFQGWILTNDV